MDVVLGGVEGVDFEYDEVEVVEVFVDGCVFVG